MDEKKAEFHAGDKVETAGKYYCEICHTEGGVHKHEFKEGEEFPACMNCGDATAWKEAPKDEGE